MIKYFKITSTSLKRVLVLWALSIAVLSSCKKMEDTYRQFFEDGETIYIGKADSVVASGGNERIEVSWLLLSDPKVSSYKLYWNNYQDSVVGEVTKTSSVDTIRVLLEHMKEGLHHFEIIMYDKLGNHSIPSRVSGRAYGEQYRNYLVNRIFKEPRRVDGTDLELGWVPAEAELLFTEIEYINTDNEEIRHIVNPDAELDTLKKFPMNGTFRVLSAYKPEPLALDTFYSPTEEFKPLYEVDEVEVDKALMSHYLLGNDRYEPAFAARPLSNLWNGPSMANGDSFSISAGTGNSFPWWFTVDLGKTYALTRIKMLSNRTLQTGSTTNYSFFFNNTAPKIFEVWGSNNPSADGAWDSWTQLASFESIKPSGLPRNSLSPEDVALGMAGEDFTFPVNETGYRYIRINVRDSWIGNYGFHLQEMTLWGAVAD